MLVKSSSMPVCDMGRLSKPSSTTTGSFRVQYRKLVEDYTSANVAPHHTDVLKFVPSLPEYLSYCCNQCGHKQKLQAEELNSIVGNAFRMAYAAQLQKPPTTIQDVIASQLDQTQTDKVLWTKELSTALIRKDKPPTTTILNNTNLSNINTNTTMDVQLTTNPSTDSPTLRLSPPSSIPGLKPTHKYNVLGPSPETEEDNNRSHQDDLIMNHQHHHHHSLSQQSTPSSDESNSPTEMNSYRRMTEKPPLIKRLAMGFSVVNQNSNNTSNNQGQVEYDDSLPLVNNRESSVTSSTPSSPTNRPLSGGYVNESITDNSDSRNKNLDLIKNDIVSLGKQIPLMDNTSTLEDSADPDFTKTKRISQISSNSSASSGQCPTTTTTTTSSTETTTTRLLTSGFSSLPQVPERTDSLNNREEGELRLAPWFQAGIPREIALEVLAQEPVGAFMVRESTSKPGCFALSLRVPRNFQPTGIAHYLIVATTKGYKIKGFTKEFTTLTSLITHHSVMPELLPCPLSLSRYNPSFVRTDSKRDFADIDLDPDYNTLADFRKMMADLNI